MRALVQSGGAEPKLQRPSGMEQAADCVLSGEDVVVRQPDEIIASPGIPRIEELPQPRPPRARNDLTHDAVEVCLWRNLLERAEVKIPVPRLVRIDPAPMQRLLSDTSEKKTLHLAASERDLLPVPSPGLCTGTATPRPSDTATSHFEFR